MIPNILFLFLGFEHASLFTIEDMQRFVDSYPEFRAMSGTVSKHVAIMTELSRLGECVPQMQPFCCF